MLKKNTDYVICEKAVFVDPKSPLKIGKGVCVSTRNYIFYLPTETLGSYALFQTYETHAHFQGVSVQQGIQNIIDGAQTVEELEESLTALLEGNPRNIHHIPAFKKFEIAGIFIKNNMRLVNSRFDFRSCSLQPKAVAREFREFHGK